MKNAKAFLPAIPLTYIIGACVLLLEGWKISAWIFFFASLLFSFMIIGILLQSKD